MIKNVMTRLLSFSLLLAAVPSFSLEIAKQIRNNFEGSLQENFPSYYIAKWRKGAVSIETMERVFRGSRNNFAALILSQPEVSKGLEVLGISRLLRAAVKGGNVDGVKFLLSKGADPNECDAKGQTALHFALHNTDTYMAGLLLACNPDLNKEDENGDSIFSLIKKKYPADSELRLWAQYLAHNYKDQIRNAIESDLKSGQTKNWSLFSECVRQNAECGYVVCQTILNGPNTSKAAEDLLYKTTAQADKIRKRLTSEQGKKLIKRYPNIYKCYFKQLPLLDIVQDPDYFDAVAKNYLGSDLFQEDENCNNALMLAVKTNSPTIARLFNYPFNFHKKNKEGGTVFSLIIKTDNEDALRQLLARSSNVLQCVEKIESETLKNASPKIKQIIADKWQDLFDVYEAIGDAINLLHKTHREIEALKADEVDVCWLKNRYKRNGTHVSDNCFIDYPYHVLREKSIDTNSISFLNLILDVCCHDLRAYSPGSLAKAYNTIERYLHEDKKLLIRESACVICGEEYGHNKKRVTVCLNNHQVCLGCYNAPQLDACPLCREQIAVDKLKICQTCCKSSDRTKFHFCPTCEHSVILCDNCVTLPCCKSPLINNSAVYFVNSLKSIEMVQKYAEHIAERANAEFTNFVNRHGATTKKDIEEAEDELALLDVRIQELAVQIKSSPWDMRRKIEVHNELAGKANALIARIQQLVLNFELNKTAEQARLQQRVNELNQRLGRMIQHSF